MELHPSSFVEYGGCTGPNYIRTQPSRETAGVLLNDCTDKYMSEFQLPYRNVKRYTQEVMQNMNKLSPQERQEVVSSLQRAVPELAVPIPMSQRRENFGNASQSTTDCVVGVTDNVNTTRSVTKELLDELYSPSDDVKSQITGTEEEKKQKISEMRKGVNEWSDDQCMAFHINWKTSLLIVLMIILFFFLGLLIGRSS